MAAETILKLVLLAIIAVLVTALVRDWLREDAARPVKWPRRLSVPVVVAAGVAAGAERTVLAVVLLAVLALLHLAEWRLTRAA
jgi:uncharacterized iron-regulated membrane protein